MIFAPRRLSSRQLLVAIFLIGFAALIYEIYSVQVLFMFFVNNTQAVAITISSFLAGLALSSLVFSWRVRGTAHHLSILFWMQFIAAGYGFLVLRDVGLIPDALDALRHFIGEGALTEYLKLGIVWGFLFVPAFFIGGALPLINGLYTDGGNTTRDVGIVYFWDMVGAVLATLLTGFVFLPKLGLALTILIPICINLLVCILCAATRGQRYLAYAALAGVLAYGAAQQLQQHGHLADPELEKRFGTVIFREASPYGTVTVGEESNGERKMFIHYRAMCASSSGNVSEGELGRLLGVMARPAERALNIGLGCGTTAHKLAFGGGFAQVDVVEINPVVKKVAQRFFAHINNHVVDAPHVRVTIENGAEFIRQSTTTYDAIAIDIEEVNIIYSSPLYTKEYFVYAQRLLSDKGVLGIWSFDVGNDFAKVMYNTLAAVFEHVVVYPSHGAMLFFASNAPLEHLPPPPKPVNRQRQRDILQTMNAHINTLDQRMLERYYNAHKTFVLPEDYTEPYFIEKTP